MSRCPWCGTDPLGFWEKQTLGPLKSRRCHQCANHVRASWPSTLVGIALVLTPFLAALVYGDKAALGGLAALLLAGGGLALGGVLAIAWNQRNGVLVRDESHGPQLG